MRRIHLMSSCMILFIYALSFADDTTAEMILFVNGTIPSAFTLIESSVTPSGVIIANYKRAGKVKTGTVGA